MTSEGPTPTELQTEFTDAPTVAPGARPRFSWRCPTDRRGAEQRACRVVVARSREAAAAGRGEVYDSGRIESDRPATTYDGPALSADATYHWSVRVWDGDGVAGEFAEPAQFDTGLPAGGWDGEWITHAPDGGDSSGFRTPWAPAETPGEPWVQVDLGSARPIDTIELHPAVPFGNLETPEGTALTGSFGGENPLSGFGFPAAYRIEASDDPDFGAATTVASVGSDDSDGGESDDGARVHEADVEARYVRVTATEPATYDAERAIPDAYRGEEGAHATLAVWACLALGELVVRDDGENLALGRPVSASGSVEEGGWGREKLVDGVRGSRIDAPAPLLRTEFELEEPVVRARLHLATPGYGEAYVDGERVGDAVLDPPWTRYDSRIAYASYDVTDALSTGEHALGLWLGRGWFSKSTHNWSSFGSPRARAHLSVTYEDGTTRTVGTDTSWEATDSPVVENDVYDGERYDARREREGWAEPGDGDDSDGFEGAIRAESPGGELSPRTIEPMRVVETFDADVLDDEEGLLLDFGQNLTGWVELAVGGAAAGDEVTVEHAEALTDGGELSRTDLRSADATDVYVARGDEEETYEPRFTYHGFRYAEVRVDGEGTVDPGDVRAKAIHTAMDRRGRFDCSDPDLRGVQHNAVWGLRGNTHSIPEDCPQRDERLGWTGDAQIATRALLFNFDGVRFHEKWARDHDDCQAPLGHVGDVIPNAVEEVPADPTWSVTRVMLPWYLYLHDGDRRVLERHYEAMRRYVDYWHDRTEEGVLPERYGKYGDWLAFENAEGRVGKPHDLFNTAFHYQVTDTFADVASVLGREADAERYRTRAETVKAAFNDAFLYPAEPTYGPGTQSALAVPLFLGLVPDAHEEAVAAALAGKVEADGHLLTGFLGTRPLVLTLAEHGYEDLAHEVVRYPERPGWVYMVRQGATTMWERWDSDDSVGSGMNSLNHSPFTFVSEWFYEVLGGLRLREDDRPATDGVTVAPAVVDGLDWTDCEVETPTGTLATRWEHASGDGYDLSVTVPWNVDATVRLPVPDGERAVTVSEGGAALGGDRDDLPAGIEAVEREDGTVCVDCGAGSYEFAVRR